jgi:hypothetical protein
MLPTLQILNAMTFQAGSVADAAVAGQDLKSQLSATQVAAAEFIQSLYTLLNYIRPTDPARETLLQIINLTVEAGLLDFQFANQSGLIAALPGFN